MSREIRRCALVTVMIVALALLTTAMPAVAQDKPRHGGELVFIIPIFEKLYRQFNGQLPRLTQFMITMSDLLRSKWYVIFPMIALIIFAFFRWKKSNGGRKKWDRFKLHIPMKIGDVVLKVTMARFTRTLFSSRDREEITSEETASRSV